MSLLALCDGDIVAYRPAASCEKAGPDGVRVPVESLEIGIARADELMHRILYETGATSYRIFLSGGENFRHHIYPQYKANRASLPRPEYLQPIREHLVKAWNAEVVVNIEADDAMGIYQTQDTIICSIDKDMLQVPGRHYNFVKNEFYDINDVDGRRHFWLQMIMGDRADNVPGYDGLMRQKVPKFLMPKITSLEEATTDEEMEAIVKEMYIDETQFEINKKLFFILREEPEDTEQQ